MTYLDIYTIGSAPGDESQKEASKLEKVKTTFYGLHPVLRVLIIGIIIGIILLGILGICQLAGVSIFTKESSTHAPTPAPTPADTTSGSGSGSASGSGSESGSASGSGSGSDSASGSGSGSGPASSFTNMEPFTNDLPYQLNNESLSISPDLDYNDFLQKMSLDKDVVEQHNQYVNDRNKVTSTASFAPSRSDNQDIVTTWGLTKPTYVPVDPSARNIPSQDPEQGSKPVRLQWK